MFGSVRDPGLIHQALAARMTEILPPEHSTVRLDGSGLICVRATNADGDTAEGTVMFGSSELRTPIPGTRRLKLYFKIWFGDEDPAHAEVPLRPISRDEIGP